MSHTAYLDQAAPLALNTDQYGNPTTTTSPPKMSDFTIGTPQRPEMTSFLTQDVFKVPFNFIYFAYLQDAAYRFTTDHSHIRLLRATKVGVTWCCNYANKIYRKKIV